MSKALFTIEDKGDKVDVQIDWGDEGTNRNSPAHKLVTILLKWMDDLECMPLEAPRMVIAAEEINQKKAEQVAHLGSERTIIHAHGFGAPS